MIRMSKLLLTPKAESNCRSQYASPHRAPSVGSIVLVPFPFSDLSQSKLRPAVVVADAGRGTGSLLDYKQSIRESSCASAVRRRLLIGFIAHNEFCPPG